VSSSKSAAATAASRQYQQLAKEAGGLGRDATLLRNDLLMPALRQTQQGYLPSYMEQAFDVQRTGLQEGGLARERAAIGQQDAAAKGGVAGGNLASTLNPAQMGALLADAMTGSRVNQGMATVQQANTLMQMGLGGAAQTGNQAVNAAGLNLQGISMLPNYNPTYAAVLGGLNAAGTIYGAGKQAGWWGGAQANGLPNVVATAPEVASRTWGLGGANWGGGPGQPINWGL